MKLELPEDRSSMGVGSAGGGEGSKEGIKQEKEFRRANRVEQ